MNKKLLSIIASTTLFSNLALADENSGFFIGTDAAWMHAQVKSELKHKNTKQNFNGDISGNIPSFGLKLGYRLMKIIEFMLVIIILMNLVILSKLLKFKSKVILLHINFSQVMILLLSFLKKPELF